MKLDGKNLFIRPHDRKVQFLFLLGVFFLVPSGFNKFSGCCKPEFTAGSNSPFLSASTDKRSAGVPFPRNTIHISFISKRIYFNRSAQWVVKRGRDEERIMIQLELPGNFTSNKHPFNYASFNFYETCGKDIL